ncbi:MAG TPA: hypothetical protein VGI96_14245 [Streptosporangiaceae bacterium]
MTSAWELLRSERRGQVGRRALVAKTGSTPANSSPYARSPPLIS